ncbi:MAG: hypothetical protein WA124_12750 [Smithella sp.]
MVLRIWQDKGLVSDHGRFAKAVFGLDGEVLSDPRFLPFSGGPGPCFVADYWFNKEAGWRSSASSGFEIQNALHFLVSGDSFVFRLNRMVITRGGRLVQPAMESRRLRHSNSSLYTLSHVILCNRVSNP